MDHQFSFMQYMAQGEVKRLIHQTFSELERKNVRAVAVLSPKPGEGKTFYSAVLAMGAAIYLKKRVVIVETNHHRGSSLFQLDQVLRESSLSKFIDLVKAESSQDGVEKAADFELGNSIQNYLSEYDLVILDTAAISTSHEEPIRASTSTAMDPLIVAKAAGHAVLVLSSASISSGENSAINSELARWNISLLGTLYNFGSVK